MVKTFYLGNADASETRNLVQQMLGASGQNRQFGFNKALNALVVRASLADLNLIQDILESPRQEPRRGRAGRQYLRGLEHLLAGDGNQLATSGQAVTQQSIVNGQVVTTTTGTSASLDNLGGIGRLGIAAIAGNIATPFLGGVGTAFGPSADELEPVANEG